MTQRILPLDLGIRADWYRANELINLQIPAPGRLVVTLVEEHTEQHWELTFTPYQAVKVTTEECIWKTELGQMFGESPQRGGFFEVTDSDWIRTLGKGEIRFLEKSRHFIVSTYDDVIEIVAWDCSVKKLEGRGYPYGEELRKRITAGKVRPDTVPKSS